MRTLVAAPVAPRKDYSFQHWAAATAGYDRIVTTEYTDYAKVCEQTGVPAVLFESPDDPRRKGRHSMHGVKFNVAWQAILDSARGFTHILSLESDIIPVDCDIVALMEENYGPEDFLCHLHPWRKEYHRPYVKVCEMGCTFGSVEVFKKALDYCFKTGRTLYGQVRDEPFTHRDIEMVELIHLDDD